MLDRFTVRGRSMRDCDTCRMSNWGQTTYGDPCMECGFEWSITFDDALAAVRLAPAQFRAYLSGAAGTERHPDLHWSVAAYVCHVVDNLRIWAERLAGITSGAGSDVAAYDQELLATARDYEQVKLSAALWSMDRSVADWLSAVEQARVCDVVLRHSERGEINPVDVVRTNAHDTCHHGWDIRRTLAASAST